MSFYQAEAMSELPLLVSCDCGYRDLRQGVKRHQKTCEVTILPAHRNSSAQQEQEATERGESLPTRVFNTLIFIFLDIFRRLLERSQVSTAVYLNSSVLSVTTQRRLVKQ